MSENKGLGPATPGTAARCECSVCHRQPGRGVGMCQRDCASDTVNGYTGIVDCLESALDSALARITHLNEELYDARNRIDAALAGETAAGPAEPAKEAVPEIVLKAENASLRPALAAAREVNTRLDAQWAAAEQRAEAAEKRSTDLMGALREAEDRLLALPKDAGRADLIMAAQGVVTIITLAALHDEERSAPPQEGEDGK